MPNQERGLTLGRSIWMRMTFSKVEKNRRGCRTACTRIMNLIPQDQMQDRTVERLVAELVPQIQEELVDVIQFILRGRTSQRIVRQTVDVSVLTQDHDVEFAKVIPQERLRPHTVEGTLAMLVPQILEETVEVVQGIPWECIFERINEQTVDVPVPQRMEEIVDVEKLVPQQRLQRRIVEQVVDVLIRQLMEETIEVVKVVYPERVSERVVEQVFVPAPQDVEVTDTGGDAEYVKKLIAKDMLSSVNPVASDIVFQHFHPETALHDEHAIANQEDVASEREARASEAVDKLADPKNVELFESTDVMGERERFARKTVLLDAYTNNLEHRSVHVGVDYWRLTSFLLTPRILQAREE